MLVEALARSNTSSEPFPVPRMTRFAARSGTGQQEQVERFH
jgi:hypothetical protein